MLSVSSDKLALWGYTSFSQHISYTLVSDGAKKISCRHLELSGMEFVFYTCANIVRLNRESFVTPCSLAGWEQEAL